MKSKKILSAVSAIAVAFSVMATSAFAAEPKKPVEFDPNTGGWFVNDFRRDSDFPNAVGFDTYDTEENKFTTGNIDMHLLLQEGYDWKDVKAIKIDFEFDNVEDINDYDNLAEIPNMAVCVQHTANDWEQHNIHIDPDTKLNCSSEKDGAVCGNNCKFDDDLSITVPVDLKGFFLPEYDIDEPNDWLKIIIVCDWDEEETESYTPGKALAHLLDKDGKVIPLLPYSLKGTLGINDYPGLNGTVTPAAPAPTTPATPDGNTNTGVAIAVVPTLIAAGVAIVLGKKRR